MKQDKLAPGKTYKWVPSHLWTKNNKPIDKITSEMPWVVHDEPNLLSLCFGYVTFQDKWEFLEKQTRACGCHFWIKINITSKNLTGWIYVTDTEEFAA